MYPLSSILSSFVTLAISLLCFIMVWIFFKVTNISGGGALEITWHALFIFVPMFLILVFSRGIGLILSVLCVYFRDIEYIYDVMMRLLLYMVPILYHIDSITNEKLIPIIKINPLYYMIELFRQCVLYNQIMDWKMLVNAAIIAVITLIVGVLIFNWKSDDIIYHL